MINRWWKSTPGRKRVLPWICEADKSWLWPTSFRIYTLTADSLERTFSIIRSPFGWSQCGRMVNWRCKRRLITWCEGFSLPLIDKTKFRVFRQREGPWEGPRKFCNKKISRKLPLTAEESAQQLQSRINYRGALPTKLRLIVWFAIIGWP